MADRDFKVNFDLDFNSRGVAALNRQLARTNRTVGGVGRGGIAGNLNSVGQLITSIERGFRRAAVAATGFGVSLGYVVRQASNLEKKQRALITLIPGKDLPNFIPQGHQAGTFNPLIYNSAQQLGVSARKGRDFLTFLAAQSFPMTHLGSGEQQRTNAFRMMAGMQGTGADVIGVARALAQISASDRFMAQEYNQLINAGLPVRAITGLTKQHLDEDIRGEEKYAAVQKIVDFYTGNLTLPDGRNLKDLIEGQRNTLDGATNSAINSLHNLSEALGRLANRGGRVIGVMNIASTVIDRAAFGMDAEHGDTINDILKRTGGFGIGAIAAGKAALGSALFGTVRHMAFSHSGRPMLTAGQYASGFIKGAARYGAAGLIGAGIGATISDDPVYGGVVGGALGAAGTGLAGWAASMTRWGHGSYKWDHKAGRAVPIGPGRHPSKALFRMLTGSGLLAGFSSALGAATAGIIAFQLSVEAATRHIEAPLDKDAPVNETLFDKMLNFMTGHGENSGSALRSGVVIVELGDKAKAAGFRVFNLIGDGGLDESQYSEAMP